MCKRLVAFWLLFLMMFSGLNVNVHAAERAEDVLIVDSLKFCKEFKPSKTEVVYNEISVMDNGNICAGATLSNNGTNTENVTIAIVAYEDNSKMNIKDISLKNYEISPGETLEIKSGSLMLDGDEFVCAYLWKDFLVPITKCVALPENPLRLATLNALETFDDTLYSEELLLWLANLYDPESGGFYFKTNAKYTEGFLPDKESTAKQIGTAAKMLGCSSKDIVNAFTPEMKQKLLDFARKYQSDEDGYWYEAPWGEYISESKKLYQTSAATQLISMVGGKPLYLTPSQRLEQTESVARLTGEDNRYNSKEDFKAWFDSLSWNTSLYGAGSLMLSNMGNIIAAGYFDYALELITERIDPETGLLGKLNTETGTFDNHEISQDAMSGTYKVISYWGQAYSFRPKYPDYPGIDNLIYSVTSIVLSDNQEYTNACHVSNAISILAHPCTKFASDEAQNYLKEKMPDIINTTVTKAMRHKTADGSYTYSPQMGAGGNQGSVHAYCIADGETSGSSMMLALRQNMYNMVSVKMPPLFDGKYSASDFADMLKAVEPTEKICFATDASYSFDDIAVGSIPQNNGFRSSGDISIVSESSTDNAICMSSPGGDRPVILFDVGTTNGKGFVCEFDFKVTSPKVCLQFEFGSYFNASTLLINDYNGSYRIAGKSFSSLADYKRMKIDYTVSNGVGENKYYIDGQLVYSSTHNTNGYPDMPAMENIPALQVRAGNDSPFIAYIDNFEFRQK
ncbi:MAG: hypothetical protein E7395_08415 [Ruminococcaceae bacterium]|nr:hypothetical protein [Oscillospiraceae bacterium]